MSGFCYAKAKAVLCCSIICASIAAQAHVQFSSRVSLIMHKVVGLTFKTRTLLPRWHRGPQVHLKLIWQCSCYALPKENQLTLSENLLLQLVLYSETAIFILCYFQIKSPAIFRLVFLKSFQVNILSKLNFHYCNSRDNLCCHGSVVS